MPKNWFSNMVRYDEPLVYEGIFYCAPENFFQAMKTEDRKIRKEIAELDPYWAKKRGRRLDLRKDWEVIKIYVMKMALRHKFKVGSSFYNKLMDTEGPIVEYNTWHDNFWGWCTCPKCVSRDHLNVLGKLLMRIRDNYKKGS